MNWIGKNISGQGDSGKKLALDLFVCKLAIGSVHVHMHVCVHFFFNSVSGHCLLLHFIETEPLRITVSYKLETN